MRNFRILVLFLASAIVLAVAACATSGVNQGDFNIVSIEEEWQLGQQLEADLANQLTLVEDPVVQRYVNQLGKSLVSQSEMAGLPWKFHVVRSEEINAFNTPGGQVYINTGLIEAAETSSELAGVVAHEVGHGVARHGTEQLTRAYGLNVVATLLLGSDPAAYQQILAQILGTGAIASFSRDAEREADGLAVEYLYEAGYDPDGLVSFFEVLKQQSRGSGGPVARFFSTHPLTDERIRYTQALVDQLPPGQKRADDNAAFQKARQRVR